MLKHLYASAALAAAVLPLAGCVAGLADTTSSTVQDGTLASRLVEIEAASGGRLGVALVSLDGGLIFAQRGGERFAMCSTFKLALAAMALEEEGLRDARLEFGADDILGYAPFAKQRAEIGAMSGLEAARNSVTLSDNTAANLLLARLGGPEGFTAWLRANGDDTTRLDRNEPTLNENAPGDPRDTTTPEAKAAFVAQLLWGDMLPPADRAMLRTWLVETPTGTNRLRAGLPSDWNPGDKTGTCGGASNREVNDIAVFETPGGSRYVLAAYLDRPAGSVAEAEAVLADAARAVAQWIEKSGA